MPGGNKNPLYSFEQILKVELLKWADVLPLASCLTNHSSKPGHWWRNRDELTSEVLLYRQNITYIHQFCADIACHLEDLLYRGVANKG